MKKRGFLIAGGILAGLCGAGILIWEMQTGKQETEDGTERVLVWNTEAVTGSVFKGTLSSSYVADGVVSGDQYGYLDYYMSDSEAAQCQVNMGDYVMEGTVLFSEDGTETVSASAGLVVDICDYDGGRQIVILNETKLYISVWVPYEQYTLITYDSAVQILEEQEQYTGYVHRLGYEYVNGEVEVEIGFDGYIMPGKTVSVCINLGESEEHLWIQEEFVSSLGGVSYTYVIDDSAQGITHMQEIELGEAYSVLLEDGTEWKYYVVRDGLEEGDSIASGPLKVAQEDLPAYYEGDAYGE